MKVRMNVTISGTRDGADWPPRGEVLEVSPTEGADLCAAGLADPIAEPAKSEKAAAPKPETRKKR